MRHTRLLMLAIIAVFLSVGVAYAEKRVLPIDEFSLLPILSEGRVMPMDSFARHSLYMLSGQEKFDGESAVAWVADTIFNPSEAVNDKVFILPLKDRRVLGLDMQGDGAYSFAQISIALSSTIARFQEIIQKQAEEKDLGEDEKILIKWHNSARYYAQLLRAMSFALPLGLDVPENLRARGAPQRFETFADAQRFTRDIDDMMGQLIAEKGADWDNYTQEDRKLGTLAFQVNALREGGQGENLFKVIPDIWSKSGNWVSPWQIYTAGAGAPQTSSLLIAWQNLAKAYSSENHKLWSDTLLEMQKDLEELGYQNYDAERLQVEKLYNLLQPIKLVLGLFLLSFLAIIGYYSFANIALLRASQTFFSGGLGILGFALLARIYVQARAPVGTLYESLLFVAFAGGVFALMLYSYRRDLSILAAGIFISLFLSGLSFPVSDGPQTMTVLEAVLNTQFWLMTHVICITIGYGWCLLAAAIAHERLFTFSFKDKVNTKTLPPLGRALKLTLVTALLFTAIGTALGGIWADQSWGRFWGWDPKENGALLIVLWIIWLLHGRLSGHINRLFMLAGTAVLSIIVALAWFGVNLLNVGLHSYGFTSGLAGGLFAFIFIELCIITTFVIKILRA